MAMTKILFIERASKKALGRIGDRDDRHIHDPCLKLGDDIAPGGQWRGLALSRQQLADADVDARGASMQDFEQRRQEDRGGAVGRTDDEAAAGAAWIEGLSAGDDVSHARQNFADGRGELQRAVGRHNAPWRAQEQRVAEQAAQPAEAMADRRRRQIQPRRGAADMALLHNGLEQDQQVEVDAR